MPCVRRTGVFGGQPMCIWNVFTTKSRSEWPQLDPKLTPSPKVNHSLLDWITAWLHHSRKWTHHCMTTEHGNVGSFLQHSITFCICVIGLQMVTWPHRLTSASYTASQPLALYNCSQHTTTSSTVHTHTYIYVCMSWACYVYDLIAFRSRLVVPCEWWWEVGLCG